MKGGNFKLHLRWALCLLCGCYLVRLGGNLAACLVFALVRGSMIKDPVKAETSDPRPEALSVECVRSIWSWAYSPHPRGTKPPEKHKIKKFTFLTKKTSQQGWVTLLRRLLGHSRVERACARCVPAAWIFSTVRRHHLPPALYSRWTSSAHAGHEPTDGSFF